jgi:dipeptidyl aminopeptidase/acylaminoacyl peptidase
MGTNMAAYVAAHEPAVDKVILNLCYSDIAEHVLHAPKKVFFRDVGAENYIAGAGGPEKMRQIFEGLSPIHQVEKLKGKSILLFQAKNDRLLFYEVTKPLRAKLMAHNVDLEYYENPRANHHFAGLTNGIRSRVYLGFLKD